MIEQTIANRQCTYCQKIIRGRTDKKFCDDYCRNGFNNQLKSTTNNLVRNTNHALGKNRRLLEGIIPEGEEMIKVKKTGIDSADSHTQEKRNKEETEKKRLTL